MEVRSPLATLSVLALLALAACAPQDAAPSSAGGDAALAAPAVVTAEAQPAPAAAPDRLACSAGLPPLGCESRSSLGLQELPEPPPYRGAP